MAKKENFKCLICTAPMEVASASMVKLYTKGGANMKCRKRRLKCTICDYQTTIYGGGIRDLEIEPQEAIDQVKENFKQERENRQVDIKGD